MKMIICLLASLSMFNAFSQKEYTAKFKNQIGLNWVFLGAEIGHGLELEYRRNFSDLSFRGAIGFRGINSWTDDYSRVVGQDENDALIIRNTKENNEGFQTSLGLEKNFQLATGSVFLVGADVLYFQNANRINHSYYLRDLNNPQPSQPMDIISGYSRVIISHNLALNMNIGYKFNISPRFMLVPRVTFSSILNNLNTTVSKKLGDPLYGENLHPVSNMFVTGRLNYGMALSLSF